MIASGVVVSPVENLQFARARLCAISGDRDAALLALRTAARQGGLTCLWCLRDWPHFDGVRDDPDFLSLIRAQESTLAAQREQLRTAGRLLTPQQLRQLDRYEHDAFRR